MALVNRGADANAGLATTPLHIAAAEGNAEAVKYLLSLGNRSAGLAANPLLCDAMGRTPRQCCKVDDKLVDVLHKAEEG